MFKKAIIISAIVSIVFVSGVILFYSPPEEVGTGEQKAYSLYFVKEGDTLSSIISSFGLAGLVDDIVSASKEVYDLTLINPGNRFMFPKKPDSEEVLIYDIDKEKRIIIKKAEGAFLAETEEIFYETELMSRNNTIKSSLFVDAGAVGVPDAIILKIAEIFAWDVDFIVDIRSGDEFSVVYEERFRDGSYVGPGKILAARFNNQGKDYFAFYYDGQYYNEKGESVARQFLRSPLNYSYISSGFSLNRVDPVTRGFSGPHRAVDYAAPHGTPVSAVADGRVVAVGRSSWLGFYVELDHGGVYRTLYAHFSSIPSGIKRGVDVSQGQTVGYVGATGHATGPHLHYEIKKYGVHLNPLTFESPSGEPLEERMMEDFKRVVNEIKNKI